MSPEVEFAIEFSWVISYVIFIAIGAFLNWRKGRGGMSDKSCYDCRHAKRNKFYEFFCHYKLIGAFCEDGKPVDSNHVCENFDYHDEDKKEG